MGVKFIAAGDDTMEKIRVYRATVRHHSLAAHRSLLILGSLTDAKRAAAREFGAGFVDHEIVIFEDAGNEIVSARRIGAARWTDRQGV